MLTRPKNPEYADLIFAFECKAPNKEWHYAKWARTLKQATDYVGALVSDTRLPEINGAIVNSAYVFPAPDALSSTFPTQRSEYIRDDFEQSVAGMFHLALMFRIGRCAMVRNFGEPHFVWSMGPNPIWSSKSGFFKRANDLLRHGRPVGSKNSKL